MTKRTCGAVLLMILVGAASARVSAWGAQGHRLVALIATERLTPIVIAHRNLEDEKFMAELRDQIEKNKWTSRSVGVPADWAMQSHDLANAALLPPRATSYDRDRDCPLQPGVTAGSRNDKWRDCAVDRITYNKERVADATLDRADRAVALKFLVHIVGDLHQPFHALGVGRGGNDVLVNIFGEEYCGSNPCNLHGVWDGALIAHRNLETMRSS